MIISSMPLVVSLIRLVKIRPLLIELLVNIHSFLFLIDASFTLMKTYDQRKSAVFMGFCDCDMQHFIYFQAIMLLYIYI